VVDVGAGARAVAVAVAGLGVRSMRAVLARRAYHVAKRTLGKEDAGVTRPAVLCGVDLAGRRAAARRRMHAKSGRRRGRGGVREGGRGGCSAVQ